MNIKLIQKGKRANQFVFASLPEEIKCGNSARYQSYNIISDGAVKIPKGTEVKEISWEGVFFGESKKNEAIVKTKYWKDPQGCVEDLYEWMEKGTVLNLIVTETWINMDVTISSFQATAYGAYGNIRYSITFEEAKNLKIYNTKELKSGSGKKKKTKSRNSSKASNGTYTVRKGDSLWKIAQRYYKSGSKWTVIYNKNKSIIETAAKKHGMKNSDHGHWIFPGTKLTIP